jgi:CHAT domain-containing protein/tetratricopeptide (TPR) repeat protein
LCLNLGAEHVTTSMTRSLKRSSPKFFNGALAGHFLIYRLGVLVCLAALAGGENAAQNAPTKPADVGTYLGAAESKEFQLEPNEKATFVVRSAAAPGWRVEFEQTREMLNVKWVEEGKTHVSRTNDAGLRSVVRFSVAGGEQEERFEVACLHPHLACAATVKISAVPGDTAGPANEAVTSAQRQEEAMAEAEDIRRHGDKTSWPVALAKFQNAAKFFEASGDPTMQRAALNGEARLLLYKLSDYQAAREVATLAARVTAGDADPQGQGLAWKTLSSAEYFLGDYEASIAAAQKAIALYKISGDEYWQGILLGNLAYTYRETGDTDGALASSEQALAIARKLDDQYGIAFNLEALATVQLSRGELEQAFEFYYQALDATRVQPYPAVEAAIWSGLGDLYSQLNDDQRAEESFEKALTLAKTATDTAGLLKVTSSLGDLYLRQGRAKSALAALEEGRREAKKLGLVREESILTTGVARSEAALGEKQLARENFQSAVDSASQIANRDAEADALLHFADFEYGAGDAARARALYGRSFELWMQESNRAQAATALASLARLDADVGDLQKAAKEIEDALGYFETSRATIASRELRTSFFSSKHAYYDLGVSIWMRLDAKEPKQGFDAKAFAVAERASSRALLDEMAGANAPVPAFVKAPADLLREQKQNQSRLDALFARLRRLADEPEKNSAQLTKVRTEIEQQLAASDALDARIRSANGGAAPEFGEAGTASVEEIARLIGSRAALAKYWVGTDESYLWLVTAGQMTSYALGTNREAIRALAEKWLDSLQARSVEKAGEGLEDRGRRIASADAAERSGAAKLGKLLLGPVEKLTEIDRIYVVPDGPLASIPFAALGMSPAPVATPNLPSRRLVSRFEILTEPSESMLRVLMESGDVAVAQPAPQIAVFADAVYSANDPRVAGAGVRRNEPAAEAETLRWATEAGMAHLPRLVASRDEAKAIAALNGESRTSIDLGFKAAADTVRKKDWSQYAVVHFGVHALLNTQRPAFSGVVLTMVDPNGRPRDGVLWLNDIYQLHMPVELVVLSGCHTANGREIPGEGLEGLSRAFFLAGARGVMGSLWSVEDRETNLLMQKFYRNLIRERLTPAAALRKAQLAFLGATGTAAPYFWAGFMVQGDGARPVMPSKAGN